MFLFLSVLHIIFHTTTIHTCTCTARNCISLISILLPSSLFFCLAVYTIKYAKKRKNGNERSKSTEKSEQYRKRRLFFFDLCLPCVCISTRFASCQKLCFLVWRPLSTHIKPLSLCLLLYYSLTIRLFSFSSSASLVSLQLL